MTQKIDLDDADKMKTNLCRDRLQPKHTDMCYTHPFNVLICANIIKNEEA